MSEYLGIIAIIAICIIVLLSDLALELWVKLRALRSEVEALRLEVEALRSEFIHLRLKLKDQYLRSETKADRATRDIAELARAKLALVRWESPPIARQYIDHTEADDTRETPQQGIFCPP
jgi:hypothetical protein